MDNVYNVKVSATNFDYTSTLIAVSVSNNMIFSEFKNIITSRLDTSNFTMEFCEIFINSNNLQFDNKHLSYFLFKKNSTINIHRKDIDYDNFKYFNSRLCVQPITRQIGRYKWVNSHIISYQLNKPIKVQEGSGYIYIIIPNGKKYYGKEKTTLSNFYNDGYNEKSFANKNEFSKVYNSYIDCYYNSNM